MLEPAAPGRPVALPGHRGSAIPLLTTLAACTCVLLLAQRSSAVAVWAALPLAAWVAAAGRAGAGWIATGLQVIVTVLIAVGAAGQLGVVAWSPSAWDALFGYPTIALASCAAAAHGGSSYLRPTAHRTVVGRALSRLAGALTPLALVVACCLGGYILLFVNPPRPPDTLVYPLPEGVSVDSQTTVCRPAADTCVWTISLLGFDQEVKVVRDRVAAHLSQANGWPADLSARRCRSWGWIATERACLELEVGTPGRDHPPLLPDLLPRSPSESGHLWAIAGSQQHASVAIVITYG